MRVAEARGSADVPGTLARSGNRLMATCGESTWLELLELQYEGKRRMPVEAFLNGVALAPGERMG